MSSLGERARAADKNMLDPLQIGINKKKAVAPAPAAAPVAMPDADSEAVAAAKRRKSAAMQQRGGRESTILGGETRLGG